MSASPAGASSSRSSVASSSILGAISATRRGVNAFVTSPRIAVCSGASVSMITGISGHPSSRTAWTSAGRSTCDEVSASRLLNVRPSFSTRRTSSWRVTTQKPNRSAKKTGARARASA